MKKPNGIVSFFLCFLINMLFTLEFCIPALVLLILHFCIDLSLMWFWIALGAWLVIILIWMIIITWARGCDTKQEPRENKNPYSVGNNKNKTIPDSKADRDNVGEN
ncbi:MAG: hypothetical protein IJN17_06565 [Clostridia bacterium]|nr:hypothetical protein [Clostridia bacterium]